MLQDIKNIKLYAQVLMPSALGVVMYTFLAALVIFLNQFRSIQQYLEVSRGADPLRVLSIWINDSLTALIGLSRTEMLVVGLFWAMIGLGVYVLLRGIASFINELGQGFEERNYLWPRGVSRNTALWIAFQRVFSRSLAFAGLVFIILVPLSRLLSSPNITSNRLVELSTWFVLLWFTLHVCVVLLRMLSLRPRLFN